MGGDDCWKASDSLRNFLFTLKNPHNIPARRFALRAEAKCEAIQCNSEQGTMLVLTFVFAITPTQTPSVTPPLIMFTPATAHWTVEWFSPGGVLSD
jgi:hypothetical protein